MTLKFSDIPRHDFLCFNYPSADFFINKDQIVTSLFFENPEMNYTQSCLSFGVNYKKHFIPAFDFEHFFKKIQGWNNENLDRKSLLNVILITRTSDFSESSRELYVDFIQRQNMNFSTEYTALKMIRHARVEHIPLFQIKQIPVNLRKYLNKKGILGCRFLLKGAVQYLMDVEYLIMNMISEVNTGDKYEDSDC